MNREHLQLDYGLRFDRGLPGAKAVGAAADVAVVVDVLSFTTTLTVAFDAGIDVLPYRGNDDSAERYARDSDAVLAVGRSRASNGQISTTSHHSEERRDSTAHCRRGLQRLVRCSRGHLPAGGLRRTGRRCGR